MALAASVTAQQTAISVEAADSEARHEVAFKLHRGFAVVVRGSIGAARSLNFLIDTGAAPSVVDRRLARKLDLPVSAGELSTFSRKVRVEEAIVSDFRLGPIHAEKTRALVLDLSSVQEALGVRVDAMIGYDLLGGSPFTIDYASRVISFGPVDPSLDTVPYDPNLPYVVVRMRVGGQEVPLLVDTGSPGLVVFEEISGVVPVGNADQSRTWSNLSGEVNVLPVDLSNSTLGAMPWGAREAFLMRGSHGGPSGFRGLLGLAALQSARVAFDPTRQVFAWEANVSRLASVTGGR